MRHLTDTNICIYVMNERHPEVVRKFSGVSIGEIGVSAVTIAELQYGVAKSGNPEKNQQRLNEFLVPFEILPFGVEAARIYGELRTRLERSGRPIGPLDQMIAAHALSENLVLVTNNVREFQRVEGLKLENWMA